MYRRPRRHATQRIIVRTTIEHVIAAPAFQTVIASPALQRIGFMIARQHVIMGRAGQVFNIEQPVAFCIPARSRTGAQADRDARVRRGIRRRIAAIIAQQGVATGTAFKEIIARITDDKILTCTARELVIACAALQ